MGRLFWFQLARREVEVAAKFDHPNVMRTFSLMASGGVIASCLELASGGDLCSRVIKDTGMGAKEVSLTLACDHGHSFFPRRTTRYPVDSTTCTARGSCIAVGVRRVHAMWQRLHFARA
jgi:hypothetical protein